MIRRTFSILFGALIFGIIAPVAILLLFDAFPFEGFKGIAVVSAAGAVFGMVMGALFPSVFGFIFEMFLDI